MKILMIHPHDIYSAYEPWTVRITSIAHEFVKKGHKVKLIHFPLPPKQRGILRCKKFKEFEVIPFNRKKWYLFKNIIRMCKLAKWADVLHFQKCFSIASLPALFAAYINNKPLHYDWDDWEYGIYQFNPPSKVYGWYLNLIEKIIPKLVDTISVSSDKLKEFALNMGIKEDKIYMAHVGADLEKFNPNLDGKRIKDEYKINNKLVVYVGQLHGAQYAELFIRAAKLLTNENIDVTFMVVGGGMDLERLRNIAIKLELGEKIIFTGAVNYDMVPYYIAAADVCVACFANTEQVKTKSPLKIAEYLASGKAIVASDIGEVKKMIKDAGILTKPGDVNALAEGIKKLLENEKLREELGIKARKRAEEEYNWKVTADSLLRAYKSIIK